MSRPMLSRDKVHVKYRKISTSDLKYDEKFLERGTYGDVRKATWQEKSVAVKMFSCAERKGGFSEELVCLSMLHEHANIVNLHGAHLGNTQTDRPFLVLEFAPYSLEKVLHQCRRELKYTADHVMSWTVQMAVALEFIHSQEMLHRDVKPSNVLLFQDGCVLKLCDFGTARKLEHTLTNAVGTSWYMAPEVIRGTYYTPSCDVYSFGVVLWEMITRHKPYLAGTHGKSMAPQSVLYRVATGGRPPMISRLPKCLEELIKRCWDEGSHKRPTTLEIKTKMERLVEIIKVERGKPFIHKRQKVEEEAGPGGVASQSDAFAREGRITPHKSSDHQKSAEGVKDKEPSSAPLSPALPAPPPSSPPPPPPPTTSPLPPPPSSPPPPHPPTSTPHPPTSSPLPPPPPTSTPHPPTSSPLPPPPPTSTPHPPTSSPLPPPPPTSTPHPSPTPPPSPRPPTSPSPHPSTHPPLSTSSPIHIPPSQHTPPPPPPTDLLSTSTPARPHNISPTPLSAQSSTLSRNTRSQTFTTPPNTQTPSEQHHFFKQQSHPTGETPVTSDPMSNSYPHGKLSPFRERRRPDPLPPSSTPVQYSNLSMFSPLSSAAPITHQDSNMSVVIEREGEEENEVSQQQRQQWFQQVEERSKSGEWDNPDGDQGFMVFPKASATSPFAIPGLDDEWQPVLPDPGDPDSINYYHNYKERAQHMIQTRGQIDILTELCAKLDQEIAQDQSNLGKNESSQHQFQALLNQKDVMMRELQQIKGELKLKQRNF